LAKDAYDELKKAYEGKTATEFYALLDSLTNITFDDRKATIEEHITHYEATWNRFVGVISRADLITAEDDGFGAGLQKFAKSDRVKAEFLLKSLPAYYSNTVENIRAKDHGYDDVARKLREYMPARQKGSWSRKEADGSKEDPLVLKVEKKDNSKRCQYCINKGWKGLNHTESECDTKKREKAKAKKTKSEEENEESDSEKVVIKMIRIGKTKLYGHEGLYEYDTAATHHTTNEYDRLVDIQHNLQLEVSGHNGKTSICSIMGTLVFRHNGRNIRYEQCLYDPSYSNIISGLRMPDDFVLQATKTTAELKTGRKVLYKMTRDSAGLWIEPDNAVADWRAAGIKKTEAAGGEEAIKEAKNLHERYGHISYNTLRTLPKFPKEIGKEKIRCQACEQGKATKRSAPKQPQEPQSTRLIERIHADLIGPIKPSTLSKEYKYLLNIIEDYSRYITVIPLRAKKDAGNALIKVINEMEAATNLRLSKIQAN